VLAAVVGLVVAAISEAVGLMHMLLFGLAAGERLSGRVSLDPMLGPIVSRDIPGPPIHLAVSEQIYPTLHNGKTPSKKLRQLIKDGHHGVRTGRGFYRWDPKTVGSRLTHFTELLEDTLKRVKRRSN
jgi:3-hydroxyacyl-CoA dehydrogenase